tara:strand:+ start:16123 stop:17112 length:990 start_codon:yes stop_codon:yes gene_type:complete
MKVLITGGAGFIGSHISEFLLKKKNIKKIIILDNFKDGSLKNVNILKNKKKIQIVKCDILNKKKLFSYFKNIDIVIHLAAMSDIVPSIEQPSLYMHTNIIGTMNVLEAMRKFKTKKIVYAASSSCYGIPKKFPTTEEHEIDTKYPYAFSKYIGELTIMHWSKVYKIDFVSLRLFNVFGTRSRTHGAYGAALGIFLKQKIENKPFTVVGNGKQKRDFIYVTDVANAFYLSLKKDIKNKILNIGFGAPNTVNEMVKIIGGKKSYIPKRPGEPFITHADIRTAKKVLKWKPKIKFRDGIKVVLKDINYWKNAPLWNEKKIMIATKNWFKYLK